MRRLGSADSPEVVRVSEDSPESSFRELDDVFLQTQARIWLGEVLHIRFSNDAAIADLIADGELLFQVSKVIWKILLKKNIEMKTSKVFIYERTSFAKGDGRYMPYPKIDSFLKICQILGLTGIDLFSPSDVVEKKNMRGVCMCIRSLSKKARSRNLNVPDFDIVTYTIAMPTNLVGGIRRYLEQARRTSSSSSWDSVVSRRSTRKRVCSKDQEQCHDLHSELDEAESSYVGTEIESSSISSSNVNTGLFILARDSPEESSEDDESVSASLEGFLTENYKDIESPNQGIHSVGAKPIIRPLHWSEPGNSVSSHVSYHTSVSSSKNSTYVLETTQTREKEAHADCLPFGNHSSISRKSGFHPNFSYNKEEMEVVVGCRSEDMSNTLYEKHQGRSECMILDEESQEYNSRELLKCYGSSNKMQILDKENEDVPSGSIENLKREEIGDKINWYTNKQIAVSQDVPHQDSASAECSYSLARKESSCAKNTYISVTTVAGGPCKGTTDPRDDVTHEYGKKTDEHYVDVSSPASLRADVEASVVPTHSQYCCSNKRDDLAAIFLLSEVPACKTVEKYNIGHDLSSNEERTNSNETNNGAEETEGIHGGSFCLKRENVELHATGEMNCARNLSSSLDPLQVSLGVMDSNNMSHAISTSKSTERNQGGKFDDLAEFGVAPFKGQNTIDTFSTSTSETNVTTSILLSSCTSDKKDFSNLILENDTNLLFEGSTKYTDETEVANCLTVATCKVYSNEVDCVNTPKNELDSNERDSVNGTKRLHIQNQSSLILDKKDCLQERGDGTYWIMESERIQESLRAQSLATMGVDNRYDYPVTYSEGNQPMRNDVAIKIPQNLKFDTDDETEIKLKAEEAGMAGGFSSTYSYYLSNSQCMESNEEVTNASHISEKVSSCIRNVSKSNCHTSVETQTDDNSTWTQQILSNSTAGIQEDKRVIAEGKNLEVEGKVSLFPDEHGSRRNSESREPPVEDQKRRMNVLVSVAGGVTAIGGLFVLLHMSAGKRNMRTITKFSSIFGLIYQLKRLSYKTSWRLASLM